VNFDGITYAKGGSVLKQLSAWVGQDHFLAGVSHYFKKHAYGNTELVDLLRELEATSGRDLGTWSKLWLETAGVNTLRPELSTDGDGTITSLSILQTAPTEWPTLRPHRMAIGFYNLTGGKLVREHRIELDVDGPRTEVTEALGMKRPDLLLINDDDLAYAKIRLDEQSLACAIANLKDIEDPLARSLVWGAVWDSTRDAEVPGRDFIDLVLGNIAAETESTVVRTVLGQLLLVATSYVDPATRQRQIDRVADQLWELATLAPAGSDNQFQFLRNFAQLANTPSQLATVQKLKSGEITLDGLDIDTDLCWELLISLAAGGRATALEIDAYLAEDNTATGAQSAAHARAALSGIQDKQAAWDSVWVEDDKPNLIVRATGLGFGKAHNPEILQPFVSQYFDSIDGIWETRSYAIAEELVESYYPAALANDELAQATRNYLAAHTPPAPLRRLIVENLAGTERTLAAQAHDIQASKEGGK
jgi:aminopeptidase N